MFTSAMMARLEHNPYASPGSDPEPAALTPSATSAEMRASAVATYFYFLVVEQAALMAMLFATGAKRSIAVWAFFVAVQMAFVRALFLAARALRSLRPNYLIFMRNTLYYALGWVLLYASRAMHGQPSTDVVAAVARLILMGWMYRWALSATIDGRLAPRLGDAAPLASSRSSAAGLIAVHLACWAIGFAILRR